MRALLRRWIGLSLVAAVLVAGDLNVAAAASGTVVALGASNTYGKGVERGQSYPAQLEALLKAAGHSVRVVNAGINGDTTGGMLARLDSAVPGGTKVVILQPGGNDARRGTSGDRRANISAITSRLAQRGIKVVIMENSEFAGLPKQSDGIHMTPAGYAELARRIMSRVLGAL
jgi:acyl-CoA thioesterase-1